MFSGRILYNVPDSKLGIRPQQTPIPTSQSVDDVLDQTEMIYQDVPIKGMPAYIKYRTYYNKKAHASKLKKSEYVYILQPKADHQGSNKLFTEFWWI